MGNSASGSLPQPRQLEEKTGERMSFTPIRDDTSETSSDKGAIKFGSAMVETAFGFWRDCVASMDRSQQQVLGLLLFSTLFKKSPDARKLFMTTNIQKQSLRLLDMFGWLLRSLNSTNNQMRLNTLKSLGDRHRAYGVKDEYFEPMLSALHDALLEMVPKTYAPKQQKAIQSLFRQAGSSMMSQSSKQVFDSKQFKQMNIPRYCLSLDHCLADPGGFQYLHGFLAQTLKRPELGEFHRAFQIYRSTLNPGVRKDVANEMMKLFFWPNSKFELRGCDPRPDALQKVIKNCDATGAEYPFDLFDGIHVWTKYQIDQLAWAAFKRLAMQAQ